MGLQSCWSELEEGVIQKRWQWSSLLFRGQNVFNSLPQQQFCTRMIWRKGLIAPGWYEERNEFILFFKSSWCKIASAARNWINSVPQTATTTFAFSSMAADLPWVKVTFTNGKACYVYLDFLADSVSHCCQIAENSVILLKCSAKNYVLRRKLIELIKFPQK